MKKRIVALAIASTVALTGCFTAEEVKVVVDETKAAATQAVEEAKLVTAEKVAEAKVAAAEAKVKAVEAVNKAIALPEEQKACGLAAMKLGYYDGAPSEIKYVAPKTYEIAKFIEAGKSSYVPATCTITADSATLSYEYPEVVKEEVVEEPKTLADLNAALAAPVVEEPVVDEISEDQVLCHNVASSLGYFEGGDYREGSAFTKVGEREYEVARYTEKPGTPMSVALCSIAEDGGVTIRNTSL